MREKMMKNVIITALLLCLVGSVSAESGLVAYYPFDGNAQDSSGNGNDGRTVNGATYVSGVSGQALSFDGVDDYISMGRLLGGNTFSAYSHEGWFKLNNIPSGNERYFIFSDETTDGQIVSAVWSDGKLHLSHHDGSTWVEILSLSEFSVGKWHHYAATWDGETLKLFIDGNLENSILVSSLSTSSSDVSIGRLKYWFDQNIENKGLFYGTIDEVKIYNRALSASEIQANYDAIMNPTTTTTVPTTTTTVPITTAPQTTTPSPSVYLYGEKTDVEVGGDISLSFSAVNLITNPEMTVQLILKVPSGMSVTSTGFTDSGAGQYTRSVQIGPGGQKQMSINIKTNQVGNFNVGGEIYYHFENESTPKKIPVELPVVVRAKNQVVPNEEVSGELATGPPPEENGKNGEKGGVCGPTALLLLAALPLGVYSLLKRRR